MQMRLGTHRMRFFGLKPLALFCWLSGVLAGAQAADRPFLHPLFCDHMVIQRDVKAPVWGWAEPGTKVTVTFAGQSRTAIVQADGKWMVHLKALAASAEPRAMTVTSSKPGAPTVTISDILVGDVWLCSGQSNMEMGIGACNVPNEIAAANFPEIRLLTVPKLIAREPKETLQCEWVQCSPATVAQGGWGGFSAAGYFFGRELHRELRIPIGLIHSSWGGTIAEAWTSPEGLRPLGDFNDRLDAVANTSSSPPDFTAEYDRWCQKNDPGTKQNWANAETDASSWKTVKMPQPFEQAGLPDFDGMVWFRRAFDLPPAWAGHQLTLGLGPIDDIDTTWVNGVKVGQMNRYDQNRVYTVQASAVNAGRNVVAVRVLDTGGSGGLTGAPEQLFIKPADMPDAQPMTLAGEWQMRDSAPLSKLPGLPVVPDANNPNVVTVLYNGMIAPLLPFAIKGAIWYQGESNADRAQQYRALLPAMIKDWRQRFGVGDFPFYIVQLAAFLPTHPEPRENNWAELREAQALTAKNLHKCGLAVAIDIGDAQDIHPKNKAEVGRRLALCALEQTYGKKVEASGPWYRAMKIQGQKIRLRFARADCGLEAKGSLPLKGFAIAGADRHFVWADAEVEGKEVVVSSPQVANPVAVRYAWDINPVCNLYNAAGLPAVPFRTDDWPLTTKDRK